MKIVIWLFLLINLCELRAQEDDFRQIIRKVFYDKEVSGKIFFEYRGQQGITFMEGYKQGIKGAFLLPDTNVQRQFPRILYIVGTSHATEKYFMTMTFISHPSANVYISSNFMDAGILLWIDFDEISIRKKNATLHFHTTSVEEQPTLKDRYIKVECELRKKRKAWQIVKLKIEPTTCCSALW